MMNMSRLRAALFLVISLGLTGVLPTWAAAQNSSEADTGRILGRIVNTRTGEPIAGASVVVDGLELRGISGVDGRYRIDGVPSGTYSVSVRMIGYATKTVTGVQVTDDATTPLDIAVDTQVLALGDIVVTASAEAGSTAALMYQRRRANTVVDAVGSEQISRSPDGNAGAVLRRVPGITVEEGGLAVVRGLNARYSSTTLNGSPLASPIPDKKVIPLDLFPSSMIESIVTSKTYSPDQPGDYAGGLVQLETKSFLTERIFSIGVSSSYNSVSTFSNGLGYHGGGLDLLGIDDGTRALPTSVPRNVALRRGGDLSPSELQAIGRDFTGAWGPTVKRLPMHGSVSVAYGDEVELFDRPIGFLASLNHSSSYALRDGMVERVFSTRGLSDPDVDYAGQSTVHAVGTGLLLNASTEVNGTDRLSLDVVLNRSVDDEARILEGYNLDSSANQRNTRIQYLSQTLANLRLKGSHLIESLGEGSLTWRAGYTRAGRFEPNTREVLYRQGTDGTYRWDNFIQSGSVFHQDLVDAGWNGGLDLKAGGEIFGRPSVLQAGGSWEDKDRSAYTRRFRFIPMGIIDDATRALDPNELFATENINPGEFEIQEATFRTDNYDATQRLGGGYVMADVQPLDKLRLVGGVRVEWSDQQVHPLDLFPTPLPPEVGADLTETTFLPSLNLTFAATENQAIRLGASHTVGRPQLRELAPFSFADYAGGYLVAGNPALQSSRILNLDARYEFFFGPTSLFAVSGFYKRFTDPIEVAVLPSSELLKSWVNAEAATNFGGEIEVQTTLGFLGGAFQALSINANLALIESEVETGGTIGVYIPGLGITQLAVVDRKRALQGQSPWVGNVSAAYVHPERGSMVSVLFNYFGSRIDAVGGQSTPDIFEEGRPQLDIVIEQPLRSDVTLKVAGTRLIGNQIEFTQGGDLLRGYDVGRALSVGLQWKPGS